MTRKPGHKSLPPGLLPTRANLGVKGAEILTLVDRYFAQYGCPKRGSRILCAVSGGADSVAMLSALTIMSAERRWTLGVAHVNHALRGAEADADERFVRLVARRLGARCHARRLVPAKRRSGTNLQAWARGERYRFFESVANRHGYDVIAIAHQLDDRAETVAAAVLDGGGTFALSGIPPVRENIIRPLFYVSRDLILAFLEEHGIDYREDRSNCSHHYQRNRIRHELLSSWKRENPSIVPGLARLGEQLWAQRRFLEGQARRVVDRALTGLHGRVLELDAHKMAKYDRALDSFVLRELSERLSLDLVPSISTVTRFSELRRRHAPTGEEKLVQGRLLVRRSKDRLRFEIMRDRHDRGAVIARSEVPLLETRQVPCPKTYQADDHMVARFDLDSLSGEVTVRWPMPGDRYQPVGLGGTKKLFDLLADRAVPSFDRPLVPVVVDNAGILWPIGHPIAHRARLTSRTRRVLEARVREASWKKTS